MSSAANHRKRSCQSFARHESAMRGERHYVARSSSWQQGGTGAPLIFRLQAFRRRVRESRAKQEADL